MPMLRNVCLILISLVLAKCSAEELYDGSYEYDDETTTTTITPAPTTARGQQLKCSDQSFGFLICRDSRHLCDNPFFSFAMKSQCARTCGMCNDAPIPQRDQECNDSVDVFGFNNCMFRKALCTSQDSFLRQRTQQDCQKSCGMC